MAAKRVLADHRLHSLCQPIEPAAHIGCLGRQPDPSALRTIQRAQARQTDHTSDSNTANKARKWLASKPGSTTRLRPSLRRISIALLRVTAGRTGSAGTATCTSRNLAASDSLTRFF